MAPLMDLQLAIPSGITLHTSNHLPSDRIDMWNLTHKGTGRVIDRRLHRSEMLRQFCPESGHAEGRPGVHPRDPVPLGNGLVSHDQGGLHGFVCGLPGGVVPDPVAEGSPGEEERSGGPYKHPGPSGYR